MTIRPAVFIAITAIATAAEAQSVCKPASDKPEAKLLAFFAGPLAFSTVSRVSTLERGQVTLAGELAFLPSPPGSISRSSGACGFNKAENSDLAPVFPRPRVAVGLGGGFVAELSYLPPVTVMDATPHMAGAAVSWTSVSPLAFGAARLTIRLHSTFGGVDGPITCPKKELQVSNTAQSCYGSVPSDDTYEPNVSGVEAVLHRRSGDWGWHAGAGMNSTASRLLVNFTDGRGFRDNNIVKIDLTRIALMAGASWQARPTLALSAQVYSVPGDATTARLGIAWRLR